ncbi:MAG TPA: NAD(P)-dependent oxidoreductase [Kofleriaceae bacterium]|nr:NAD(P)-dependent oxidoreductase [Kofleriaceae bacterium]
MSRHPALPVSLYVVDRLVVIVGDGPGADERQRRLAAAGARIARIAADAYQPHSLEGAFLVLAHDDDSTLNERVAGDARAAGCLAYAHDRPDLSDLAMPALIRRGPLAIAVSTDGAAPALSRRLRQELEAMFDRAGPAIDALVAELETARASLPRGARRAQALSQLAARLRVAGEIAIETSGGGEPA